MQIFRYNVILYVIQLSDRVYNVTFPAYDLYNVTFPAYDLYNVTFPAYDLYEYRS